MGSNGFGSRSPGNKYNTLEIIMEEENTMENEIENEDFNDNDDKKSSSLLDSLYELEYEIDDENTGMFLKEEREDRFTSGSLENYNFPDWD